MGSGSVLVAGVLVPHVELRRVRLLRGPVHSLPLARADGARAAPAQRGWGAETKDLYRERLGPARKGCGLQHPDASCGPAARQHQPAKAAPPRRGAPDSTLATLCWKSVL
jgi:hypothetical protein